MSNSPIENEAQLWLDRNSQRYEPGEEITVRWRLADWREAGVVSVEASLLWYTVGEGEEDFAVHHFERHRLEPTSDQDELDPLESDPLEPLKEEPEQSFKATLPLSPCSYDGQIVKICWTARLRGFFPKGKQRVVEEPFWLSCDLNETTASPKDSPSEVRK